jgi:acetolactate synthase-1/2/3 large subunit
LKTTFCVSGGAIMSLTDALKKRQEIDLIYNHHEQASVMAAEGWARSTGSVGTCFLTVGPGATNGITGVLGAWMDSVPIVVFSGQSFESQTIGNSHKRQEGTQEANILEMVKPVTKLAIKLNHKKNIKIQLDHALKVANSGRKGPVWIEIGADTQKVTVQFSNSQVNFNIGIFKEALLRPIKALSKFVIEKRLVKLIKKAKRPILLIGAGVQNADIPLVRELLDYLKIPVMFTHNSLDKIEFQHPCHTGFPGIFGNRFSNLTVQSCDLLISVGSRLTHAQTGYNFDDFARNAKRIVVDIDQHELIKKNIRVDLPLNLDASSFLQILLKLKNKFESIDDEWNSRAQKIKFKYASMNENHTKDLNYVNSYIFVDTLSKYLSNKIQVNTDMGLSYQSTYQGIKLNKGNRLITNTGFASMGWGISSAIGICLGANKATTVCLSGDGGLMMNLQELATIRYHELPIMVFIYNNQGYLTQKQSQEIGFNGNYTGVDTSSGLFFPDWAKIASGFDLDYLTIENDSEIESKLKYVLEDNRPKVIDLKMTLSQHQIPKAIPIKRENSNFSQSCLENPYPFMDENTLNGVMNYLRGSF